MQPLNRLAELVSDWVHLVRRDGWREARPEIQRGILSLPYRRIHYLHLSRPLSLSEPVPQARPKVSLAVRPFERRDLEAVRGEFLPSEARLCAKRLEHGHLGFVAVHDGRFAGCAWACTDLSLERVDFPLEVDDILFNDAFTATPYRRKGVHNALMCYRLAFFRDRGYRRAVGFADASNTASVNSWLKVGARVVGDIRYKRVFNWRQSSYERHK